MPKLIPIAIFLSGLSAMGLVLLTIVHPIPVWIITFFIGIPTGWVLGSILK